MTITNDTEFLKVSTVIKTNLIEGWKRGQMILEEFSKIFGNQYLVSLRDRVVVNLIPKVGDIVQIKDGHKMEKIIKLVESADGHCRVAKVATSPSEILTRSIALLYPLEFEDESKTILVEDGQPKEPVVDNREQRPIRTSAQEVKKRMKEWTAQLFAN